MSWRSAIKVIPASVPPLQQKAGSLLRSRSSDSAASASRPLALIARPKTEGDIVGIAGPARRVQPGDLHESNQARTAGLSQHPQAVGCKDAVFTVQRDQIGNRAIATKSRYSLSTIERATG